MTSQNDEFEDLHGNPEREVEQVDEPITEFADEPDDVPVQEEAKEFDDAEYGTKVQKRINKEVSKRKALESTLSQQQAYIASLQERLNGIEQRFSSEDQQRQQQEASQKLEDLKAARRRAYEEGDLETYDKLDDQYLDAKAEALVNRQAPKQQARQPQQQAQPQQEAIPTTMKLWMDDNSGWFNNRPESAQKVKAANAMFDVMTDEGFDENDPQTYAELNRRLSAAGVIAKRSRDPMGAAPPNRYAGGPSSKSEFSNEDARIMRKYGLDPNDPKVRASYMRDKDGSSTL